ncbi:unnamed protein product [Alternaria alternata]
MRINTFEDVADSEDEFHMNRDKILLDEGPAAKRMRKYQEEDKFLQPYDEEVLDAGSDEDDDDEDDEDDDTGDESEDDITGQRKPADEDEEEDVGGWGASKKDYYDADAIETEQDALDEEAEARRIQKKQLQNGEKAAEGGAVVTEVLPQLQITDSMSEEERMKIMRTRYPEFEHISKEYLRLQPLHEELAAAANAAERVLKAQAAKSGKTGKTLPTPKAVTKYRACAAYLAAMAMYFAVLGSTATDDGSPVIAMDPADLHEHPVMETLLKCQKVWTRIEDLPLGDPMVEAEDDEEDSFVDEISVEGLENDLPNKTLPPSIPSPTKPALKKAAPQEEDTSGRIQAQPPQRRRLRLGEETELTAHEAAEKAKKKKSLRFYTSQIAQKANKRDNAGKDQGGDADIPHRERLKDRQARLQAEAEKRGQHKDAGPGVALGEDDGASSADEAPGTRRDDFEDEDGYYDMTKLERAEAYALAKKEGAQVVEEEVIGDDGRRMISTRFRRTREEREEPACQEEEKYKEKQKKLKSMKQVFDKGAAAKGSANYGGELTGIKSGLVRSRKL